MLAFGLSAPYIAQAAQLGPYVGGLYGMTERQDDGASFESFVLNDFYPALAITPTTHLAKFENEDQGYAVLAGYRVHANLAIEGMFAYLGEVEYRAYSDGTVDLFDEEGNLNALPLTVDTVVDSELTGLGVYALGIWPISYRWEAYARAGLQFSTGRTNVRTTRIGGTERIGRAEAGIRRESELDLAAGVGMAMSVFDIYGLRIEYLRVFEAGHDAIARGDADMLSLGFIVAF